jgi:hypothetical protein
MGDKLKDILEKIQEDDEFTKEYSLTMESQFSDSYFITVKRKERSLEDRLTYNPSVAVGIDYRDTNTGFCILLQSGYMSDVVRIRPVSYDDAYVKRGDIIPVYYDNSRPIWKMGHSIPGIEHYTQTLTFLHNDVDIGAIKKYIINTESNIINKRTYEHDCILPSNSKSVICDCCKQKIKGGSYDFGV